MRLEAIDDFELLTGYPEVWQRADGTWNWVLIDRPSVHEPADVVWDLTPYATAPEALAGFTDFLDRSRAPDWNGPTVAV